MKKYNHISEICYWQMECIYTRRKIFFKVKLLYPEKIMDREDGDSDVQIFS
jgi:hypothetical protein